jgi:hypothetical protein
MEYVVEGRNGWSWSEGRGKYSDRNKSGDNGKGVRFFIVILG